MFEIVANRFGPFGIMGHNVRPMVFLIAALALSGCVTTGADGPKGETLAQALATGQAKEKLDPDYRKQLLLHGGRALEAEKYEEAVATYKRVLSVEPENPDATYGMAETMLAVGKFPDAMNLYQALHKQDAFRARAQQGEGIVLLALGQTQLSVDALRAAVGADPTLWRAWNALGRALDVQDKHDEALKSYDKALEMVPNSAIVLNNRGVSNILVGRYVEAESDLRKAVAADRDLDRARSNLRLALAWQGKYVEALADVSRVDAPVALNNIGYIAMKRGDLSHAEAYFAQAMQLSPAFYDKADRNLRFLNEIRALQKVADTKKG